jgi:hypothetical protein
MRVLKDNDFKTFEQLCALTQKGMKKAMSTFLRSRYKKVIETEDYIVAEGNIPIALAAHMDTVFPRPASEVFYDRVKNVIWSPEGLGADDRAGIFAIVQIIRKGLRPHIILTTDEEKGAFGAIALACEECPFKDLRYIIQLDRRGTDDCVFYDCDNQKFVDYIEKFGFTEALGSFTDISVICPEWKVAGVNLSVGYRDEHSVSEVLFVGQMLNTIDKVIKMLQEPVKKIPTFEYIPKFKYHHHWYRRLGVEKTDDTHCTKCGKNFTPDEMIPVKTPDFKFRYYCPDCIVDNVNWCVCCGEAYEIPSDGAKMNLCEDCFYDFYYSKN